MLVKQLLVLMLVAILSACASSTVIHSSHPGSTLRVNKEPPALIGDGLRKRLPTTSFGQYPFKLTPEDGEPMYGLMPLKFRGGVLALDILLFAPATFFNLRGLFPYYEFDAERGAIRYRNTPDDPWSEYQPTAAEIERARAYFGE